MSELTFTPSGGGRIVAMPADEYHADPCDTPSLSASLAVTICQQSPRHAWAQHPRLNPDYAPEEKAAFDLGTVVHQLVLEGHADCLAVVDAPDWRTNGARAERDAAYAAGKTPLLAKELPRVTAMYDAVVAQFDEVAAVPPLFSRGQAEPTLLWSQDGVACRSRLDWLHDGYQAIDDLKTVGRSAEPEAFTRTLFSLGYHIKAAFYIRAVETVTGHTPVFRIVAIETSPPYALSVISLADSALRVGSACVDHAIETWKRCLEAESWPGYAQQITYAEAPKWEQERWLAPAGYPAP